MNLSQLKEFVTDNFKRLGLTEAERDTIVKTAANMVEWTKQNAADVHQWLEDNESIKHYRENSANGKGVAFYLLIPSIIVVGFFL